LCFDTTISNNLLKTTGRRYIIRRTHYFGLGYKHSSTKKKAKYWLVDLKHIMKTRRISHKQVETLVGRFNHSAAACPLSRYFLNRLRNLLTLWNQVQSSKKCERYLSKSVLGDLKLWHDIFLPKITSGICLNLTLFHRPNYICWSDACP
jgi:hypothetical protein